MRLKMDSTPEAPKENTALPTPLFGPMRLKAEKSAMPTWLLTYVTMDNIWVLSQATKFLVIIYHSKRK